jgi:hypothetical protein
VCIDGRVLLSDDGKSHQITVSILISANQKTGDVQKNP